MIKSTSYQTNDGAYVEIVFAKRKLKSPIKGNAEILCKQEKYVIGDVKYYLYLKVGIIHRCINITIFIPS